MPSAYGPSERAREVNFISRTRLRKAWYSAVCGRLALALLAAGVGAGCQQQAPTIPPPPPPAVSVARPVEREVIDYDVYTGRLASPESVDVHARVSGFIEQAPFTEGTIVKQGDLLFVIDVRPFQAELNRAEAELARARAQQRFAIDDLRRLERLLGEQAAAELEILQARRDTEQANAAVAAAEAAVEAARLNVEWCRVTAPITGRVGRKLVTPGNLITGGQSQATLLTTIESVDPMYCYVDVDERSVRKYQEIVRSGARPSAREVPLPVQLALVDEDDFHHQGYINFIDNKLDPGTGTIQVRGEFPNPTGVLLPGFFARLRIPGRGPYKATLVPEEAIGTNLAQQYVLVVDAQQVVRLRPVKTGETFYGLRSVEGVSPDDRIIVKGLVQARPGSKVRPEEVSIAVAQALTQPADAIAHHQWHVARATTRPAGSSGDMQTGRGSGLSGNGPVHAGGDGGTGAGDGEAKTGTASR
ncbi:MAG: efflux RND transporter periplasmic adaptor subunit [Phycisphaerae bacterium]|nr:efflux RND transporter periplasmic adaptor subunit [Phycisphaerae bacterium]